MGLSKSMSASLSKSLLANEKPVFFENQKLGSQAERLTEKKMLSKLVGSKKPELFQQPNSASEDPFSNLEVDQTEVTQIDEDESLWLDNKGLNRRRRLLSPREMQAQVNAKFNTSSIK